MTKLRLLIPTLVFFIGCSTTASPDAKQAKEAIITATSEFNNQWLYLVKPDGWSAKPTILDSCLSDENGAFKMTASVPKFGEYIISGRGYFISSVFLENGFELEMNVVGKGQKKREVSFVGEKQGNSVNSFWISFYKRFFSKGGYNNAYKELVKNSIDKDFQVGYNKMVEPMKTSVDSFMAKEKRMEGFGSWINSYVKFATYGKYFTFLIHKPQVDRGVSRYWNVEKTYYDFLENVDLNSEPEHLHNAYSDFVHFYVIDQNARNSMQSQNPAMKTFEEINDNMSGNNAALAGAFLIKDYTESAKNAQDFGQLRAFMTAYSEWPLNENYIQVLQGAFSSKAVLAPGSPAPNFTFENIEGEQVSLTDYVGKAVVLDFWGTWCGPCKRELPFSKKIEESYADRDDIVFLFVALEKGPKNYWKQYVNSNNLPGEHLYSKSGDKSLFPYQIRSVPRYVLIDKEGNLYDAHADRPSGNMRSQIEKLLAE